MTMLRNHEEEVGLRLQFEGKLNQLNSEYRELDIKFNRNCQQLAQSAHHVNRLDTLAREQSEQLVGLRTNETDMISRLQ